MTTPRSTQIDLGATPYYHIISRCVRQSYLCGYDVQTKRDLNHRKVWLVNQIKHLASIFYIQIAAYAIMDNHYHLVLHVDSTKAYQASRHDILSRWKALFPKNAKQYQSILVSSEELNNRIELWRKRFMDISTFMKLLNEHMARLANKEDDCNGRFWQGRFKSQALLDDAAVLGAMVYVDLNTIRAKMAETPESSEFTSIYERIQTVSKQLQLKSSKIDTNLNVKIDDLKQPNDLMSFGLNQSSSTPEIEFNLSDYIQLVETTGRFIRDDNKGHIPNNLLPIFQRLNIQPSGWISLVTNLEDDFYFAVGSPEVLQAFGRSEKCLSTKAINNSSKHYLVA